MTDSDKERLEHWLAPLRDLPPKDFEQGLDERRERRAAGIENLAQLIRLAPHERERAKRRLTSYLVTAAAAALVLVTFGFWSYAESEQGTVQASAHLRQVVGKVVAANPGGKPRVVGETTSFEAGDEVSTTAEAFVSLEVGRARVDVSSATIVKLLKVDPTDQAYQLNAGRIDISLPRVAGEQRSLQVRTPNALVEVRGTVFSVEVTRSDDGPITTVQVTRGSVAVNAGSEAVVLKAGQSWSSFQSLPVHPSRAVHTATPPTESEGVGESKPDARRRISSLAEQNRLFGRALSAREHGEHAQAVRLFDEFIRSYPNSPLLTTARSQRHSAAKALQENTAAKALQENGTAK